MKERRCWQEIVINLLGHALTLALTAFVMAMPIWFILFGWI